jgi:hypothetical protein
MCPRPRADRGRTLFCNGQNFSGGGTASMSIREKGWRSPLRSLHAPSHVPSHRRMPPKCGTSCLQPRGSRLRQTVRWRKADSNRWSHLRLNGSDAGERDEQIAMSRLRRIDKQSLERLAGTGSLRTRRWRGESCANSSLLKIPCLQGNKQGIFHRFALSGAGERQKT